MNSNESARREHFHAPEVLNSRRVADSRIGRPFLQFARRIPGARDCLDFTLFFRITRQDRPHQRGWNRIALLGVQQAKPGNLAADTFLFGWCQSAFAKHGAEEGRPWQAVQRVLHSNSDAYLDLQH